MKDVKDIRITDPYIRRRVESARRKAGEATVTRTAGRLILERLAQLERNLELAGVGAASAGEAETSSR